MYNKHIIIDVYVCCIYYTPAWNVVLTANPVYGPGATVTARTWKPYSMNSCSPPMLNSKVVLPSIVVLLMSLNMSIVVLLNLP